MHRTALYCDLSSWQRPLVQAIQYVLRETSAGSMFFNLVVRVTRPSLG